MPDSFQGLGLANATNVSLQAVESEALLFFSPPRLLSTAYRLLVSRPRPARRALPIPMSLRTS